MNEENNHEVIICDTLIIGSGIAGLNVAWKLAKGGQRVIIVTKKAKAESNTNYAQGGIAAVFSGEDSFDSHVQDTLRTGDGWCDEKVVRFVVEHGPKRVRELIDLGVEFTEEPGKKEFDLGKEAGHTHRRVVHAKDLTGREIETALLRYCEKFDKLTINEHFFAIDLIRAHDPLDHISKVFGAHVFDSITAKTKKIIAYNTVLATGGIGKVYLVTTNPDIATGDGIAMAYRAGALIANMEFIQFHPTCLYHPEAKSFLISEAVRGEGGVLTLK